MNLRREQLLNEIREANMTYLMLAQNLIRQDKAEALFRLGMSEESADLIGALSAAGATVVVVTGESDQPRAVALRTMVPDRVKFLSQPPLPALAAVFERCAFYVGHDTGISHLAAAAGAECLLLFGPTDPAVWAPANPDVNVLRAPDGLLHNLSVEDVKSRLPAFLSRK